MTKTNFTFNSVVNWRIRVEETDIIEVEGEQYVKLSSLASNPEIVSKFTTTPKVQKKFNARKVVPKKVSLEAEEIEELEY